MEIDSAAFHAAGGWVGPLAVPVAGPRGVQRLPLGPLSSYWMCSAAYSSWSASACGAPRPRAADARRLGSCYGRHRRKNAGMIVCLYRHDPSLLHEGADG